MAFVDLTVVSLIYNTGGHIIQSLQSIRDQTYKGFTHIIIDDASTDESYEIVERWIEVNDYECVFIRNDKNLGICETLNKGIRLTKTPYFTAVGDDILLPHKLEQDIKVLRSDNTLDFCYSKVILKDLHTQEKRPADISGSQDLFKDYFSAKASIPAPTLVFRTESLINAGYYDESLFFEDLDMLLRILYKGKAAFINDFTVEYIRTSNSLSSNSSRFKEVVKESFFLLEKRWGWLPDYRKMVVRRKYFYFRHFTSLGDWEEAVKYGREAISLWYLPKYVYTSIKLLKLYTLRKFIKKGTNDQQ